VSLRQRQLLGPLAAGAILAGTTASCSSQSSNADAGAADSGSEVQNFVSNFPVLADVDGTTGRPCTNDADCTRDGGPGVNRCSVNQPMMFTGVTIQSYTSSVCVVGVPDSGGNNCDPGPLGTPLLHFCDGPDDPSSPGVCVRNAHGSGFARCLPQCTFQLDGAVAIGCLGKTGCHPIGFAPPATATANSYGVGYCTGFCVIDSDCNSLGPGYACQSDIGYCTMTKVARPQTSGASCSMNAVGPECDCAVGSTLTGYCTTSCMVGGAPCGPGWVCDNGIRKSFVLQFPSVSNVPGARLGAIQQQDGGKIDSAVFGALVTTTKENPGTVGRCYASCTAPGILPSADASLLDSGSVADSGDDGALAADSTGSLDDGSVEEGSVSEDGGRRYCPPNASCESKTVSGPDCVPQ